MKSALARAGRPLLGTAVFIGALAVWEIWSRRTNSFVVPTVTAVLESAWQVWPTTDFLAEAAGSLERLAAGQILAKYTKVDPKVIAKTTRFSYATRLRVRMAQPFLDLYAEYDLIPDSFKAIDLVK